MCSLCTVTSTKLPKRKFGAIHDRRNDISRPAWFTSKLPYAYFILFINTRNACSTSHKMISISLYELCCLMRFKNPSFTLSKTMRRFGKILQNALERASGKMKMLVFSNSGSNDGQSLNYGRVNSGHFIILRKSEQPEYVMMCPSISFIALLCRPRGFCRRRHRKEGSTLEEWNMW